MSTEREDEIRTRAYQFWEEEGRPEGRHEDHWHRAAGQARAPRPVDGGGPVPTSKGLAPALHEGLQIGGGGGAAPPKGAQETQYAQEDHL